MEFTFTLDLHLIINLILTWFFIGLTTCTFFIVRTWKNDPTVMTHWDIKTFWVAVALWPIVVGGFTLRAYDYFTGKREKYWS